MTTPRAVVSVTLNPSVDRTVQVPRLRRSKVNRAASVLIDAGGKGVNVSRACHSFGVPTHAIVVGGGLGGRWISDQLEADGIAHTLVWGGGLTRSNLTIVEDDGTVTKINEPGSPLESRTVGEVQEALQSLEVADAWVVFAGGLNPNAPSDTYVDMAATARSRGALVAVDASDGALAAVVRAGEVDLIKPNQHELGQILGRPLRSVGEALDAACEVVSGGVGKVLVSLGADGALLVTADTAVHIEPVRAVVGTPVGAGDVLLGTFLAGGADAAALPAAVAWSSASVALPGTAIPTPAQAALVEVLVHPELDGARSLVEVA
jgi:1-phosphofructokinase